MAVKTVSKSSFGIAKNRSKERFYTSKQLDSTGNLAGAEATSTYVDMAGGTVDERLYTADIGFPSPVGTPVGVGNLNPKSHTLAANIALCHFPAPPYLQGIG